jgi:hypothetical protein
MWCETGDEIEETRARAWNPLALPTRFLWACILHLEGVQLDISESNCEYCTSQPDGEFVGTLMLDTPDLLGGFPFLDRIETLFVAIKLKDEQLRLSLCQSDSRQFHCYAGSVQQGD